MAVIVWLRRDLRLEDNIAIHAALQTGQPIIPVFIFDPTILKSRRMSARRVKFMLAALQALDDTLRQYNRRLLLRQGTPVAVLRQIAAESGAERLFFNIDYTPYARKRDEQVIHEVGIPVETFHDRLLVPPEDIAKNDSTPYTVYTPFKNRWRSIPKADAPLEYEIAAAAVHDLDGIKCDPLPTLQDLGFDDPGVIPEAGASAALKRLEGFMRDEVYEYVDTRNRLGDPYTDPHTGTSFMSPYIRFGLVSLRQVRHAAAQAYRQANTTTTEKSVDGWMGEIIWHEFYTHVLWHFPHVNNENFNPRYNAVQWRDAPDDLAKWQQGLTGYPVVDAAMRQMREVGWMHNRARMIVGSFLCKDLLIHWKPGELYFMQQLMDGDLAQNNGGWQWVASTGTDAQPYFRIFNPITQGEKFDPEGAYIRRYVPELRDVPKQFIHKPWTMDTPPRDYPPPMVDHSEARQRTLAAFGVVKQEDEA